ncbi:MAG: NAD-binding protein [Chloroflexi bacterium]|nr:NAD-binding protein [Chloroflexota bacterium]
MKTFSWRHKLSYRFDTLMSRGTAMHLAGLFLFSAALIVLIALLARLTPDGKDVPVLKLIWMGLMRTLDSGTMGGDEGSWPFLFLMFAVTLGGVFIVGALIGVITTGIDEKLSQLRKGRSRVVEQGHTVILGWSDQVFSILSELALANQNQRDSCVAILAEQDKAEMEDEIRARVPRMGRMRVVCRTGRPADPTDLEIVNPGAARAVIILPVDGDNADAEAVKTILALTSRSGEHALGCHVVAEMSNPKFAEVAKMVGGDHAFVIQADELIARITAQTCRQSGLSAVYMELLDFGGDEIYFQHEPALTGKTFGEALLAYEASAVIGLRYADGRVQLNPPAEMVIQTGDKIIAVSEDDDTIRLSGKHEHGIPAEAIVDYPIAAAPAESILVLGWNRRGAMIVRELDHYVGAGSRLHIVADVAEEELRESCECFELQHLVVTIQRGDITDRRTLDTMDIPSYQHVILLGYADSMDVQDADSHTLVALLHLRDIEGNGSDRFSIVSEMLDIRNRELAENTHADDFIVSDKLISLLMTQIAENKELSPVFQDLFDPEGAEIYIRPASAYVTVDRPVNFYTVVESARRKGQVALGYRLERFAQQADKAYGVSINPKKSELVQFTAQDRVIVLAEE